VIAAATAVAAVTVPLMVGHAAGLSVGSGSLGAGTATLPRCALSGFTVAKTVDALNNTVTAVVVSQIPGVCGGAQLSVTVDNGTASSSQSGTVAPAGGSLTLVLPVAVALTASEQIDVVVSGP
jgi:hypothetical protein